MASLNLFPHCYLGTKRTTSQRQSTCPERAWVHGPQAGQGSCSIFSPRPILQLSRWQPSPSRCSGTRQSSWIPLPSHHIQARQVLSLLLQGLLTSRHSSASLWFSPIISQLDPTSLPRCLHFIFPSGCHPCPYALPPGQNALCKMKLSTVCFPHGHQGALVRF